MESWINAEMGLWAQNFEIPEAGRDNENLHMQ